MSDKWVIEGVRGELTNDTVFVRNAETGERRSVCVTYTTDEELRAKEVGEKIARGEFDK